MGCRIRQARESDIDTLARFEAEISAISFAEEAITDLAFHAGKIRKALEKGGAMFVMESDERKNEITGWLWMDIKTNFLTQERYVNFRSFYIKEDTRGGKEGGALLQYGLDYCAARGVKSVVGKTHTSNLPMRALYKSMGFKATHITMEYRLD